MGRTLHVVKSFDAAFPAKCRLPMCPMGFRYHWTAHAGGEFTPPSGRPRSGIWKMNLAVTDSGGNLDCLPTNGDRRDARLHSDCGATRRAGRRDDFRRAD